MAAVAAWPAVEVEVGAGRGAGTEALAGSRFEVLAGVAAWANAPVVVADRVSVEVLALAPARAGSASVDRPPDVGDALVDRLQGVAWLYLYPG